MRRPFRAISLGAGVQSSTMALMADRGLLRHKPRCAIFADTKAEPRAVYDWLDWLEAQLSFPVYRVSSTRTDLPLAEIEVRRSKKSENLYRNAKIPAYIKKPDGGRVGMLPRKCTGDYKVDPILRELRRVAEVPRGAKIVCVEQWLGISTDEASRMKPAPKPWIRNRWPLIELNMSRADCLAWMEEQGFPRPPRSACTFCPYHSDAEWIHLRDNAPEEFAAAVRLEKRMQRAAARDDVSVGKPFLHRSAKPLDKVDFEENADPRNDFENECEGMCGV